MCITVLSIHRYTNNIINSIFTDIRKNTFRASLSCGEGNGVARDPHTIPSSHTNQVVRKRQCNFETTAGIRFRCRLAPGCSRHISTADLASKLVLFCFPGKFAVALDRLCTYTARQRRTFAMQTLLWVLTKSSPLFRAAMYKYIVSIRKWSVKNEDKSVIWNTTKNN